MACLFGGTAYAACPVIPYTFANGTVWDADQVNANFTALRNCVATAVPINSVTNSAAVRALTAGVYSFVQRSYNTAPGDGSTIYYWDAASTCADDGNTCLKPNSNPATGRWVASDIVAGHGSFTDNKTGPLSATGAGVTMSQNNTLSVQSIIDGAFLVPGATIYSAAQAVGSGTNASTANIVSGLSSFQNCDLVTAGSGFPACALLFAAGSAARDGAKQWGINTLLSDTGAATGAGTALNGELDYNVTKTGTTVNGLQLAGSSTAQASLANGFVLNNLDAPNFGTVARWSTGFISSNGATDHFASIGAVENSGSSINSQDIVWNYRNSVGSPQTTAAAWTPAGLTISSTETASLRVNLNGAGAFSVGDLGGFDINGLIAMSGNGATLSVGGDTGWTTQNYANASATTTVLGTNINLTPTAGNTVTIGAGYLRLNRVAYAGLTACAAGLQGDLSVVTDASTAVFGSVFIGGGTNVIIAMCDGTNWVVH